MQENVVQCGTDVVHSPLHSRSCVAKGCLLAGLFAVMSIDFQRYSGISMSQKMLNFFDVHTSFKAPSCIGVA